MMQKMIQRLFNMMLALILVASAKAQDERVIDAGLQPQISSDNSGTILVAYGRNDSIFCATATTKNSTFSTPVFVGHIRGMHLGNTRGPQIATSANYTIITAIDQVGNIHVFRLTHATNQWEYKGMLNDIQGSAPEGLMSIAADAKDYFYAVWLDIRHRKTNNIAYTSISATNALPQKNRLVYLSPDGHVCECCKPTIDVKDGKVAIMFRNWLNGSRDLYLLTSSNSGASFSAAQKLGTGTWKLNACPMDGGSVRIDDRGETNTVWQRQGTVYYSGPKKSEVKISDGRLGSLAGGNSLGDPLIAWQDGRTLKLVHLTGTDTTNIGKGAFLKSIILPDNDVLCVWERDKQIMYKTSLSPPTSRHF